MSYDYNVTTTTDFGGFFAFLGGMILFVILFSLAISIFYIIVYWKLFKKANQEGWASIVPIYNLIILMKITEMPLWWLALLLVPFVNFIGAPIFFIVFSLNIAKVFGKDTTFGILTIFFSYVTLPILAFSDAQYVGHNNGASSQGTSVNPTQPVNNENFVPQTNQFGAQVQPETNYVNYEQSVNTNQVGPEVQPPTIQNVNPINQKSTIQPESTEQSTNPQTNIPTWTTPEQTQNNDTTNQ